MFSYSGSRNISRQTRNAPGEQRHQQQQLSTQRSTFAYQRTPSTGGISPREDMGYESGGRGDHGNGGSSGTRRHRPHYRVVSSDNDDNEEDDEDDDNDNDNDNDDTNGTASSQLPRHRHHQHQRRHNLKSQAYTQAEEKAILRKLDRRLVLFLAFLYLLSFLDRSNIGNARIAGLEESLSLTTDQFDWLLVAFYVTYITFEWMILMYRLVPAHVYISGCVLAWGLVASLQSVVTSFRQLVVLRAVLGVTEAAFGPGVPFYMTFFYRRSELAYRVGLQISAAPLATSFASTLAYVIVWFAKNVGGDRIEPWRALFLVEGFPSVIAAVVAWYWIPDSPGTAAWLNSREREVATARLLVEDENRTATTVAVSWTGATEDEQELHQARKARREVFGPGEGTDMDNPPNQHNGHSKLNMIEIFSTLTDPKAYLTALMFLSVNVSFASLPVFLPTIINDMSFSPLTSQILSAPPYLVSFVFVLVVGHYSDRIANSRSIFLCGVSLLSCLSYATIAIAGSFQEKSIISIKLGMFIRYFAIYPAAMGLFASVVLIITWTLNNQASQTKKGMGMVMLNVVGQCGPLIGVRLFPKRQGPFFVNGMAVCAAFMAGVFVLALVLRAWLARLNRNMGLDSNGDGDSSMYEMVGLRRVGASHVNGVGDGDFDLAPDPDEEEDDGDDQRRGLMRRETDEGYSSSSVKRRDKLQFRFML